MKSIPINEALTLLDKAYAIIQEGAAEPVAFRLSLDEDAFLKMHHAGPETGVSHTFLKEDNHEVKITGQTMTLADDSGFHEEVRIQVLVPLGLEELCAHTGTPTIGEILALPSHSDHLLSDEAADALLRRIHRKKLAKRLAWEWLALPPDIREKEMAQLLATDKQLHDAAKVRLDKKLVPKFGAPLDFTKKEDIDSWPG